MFRYISMIMLIWFDLEWPNLSC